MRSPNSPWHTDSILAGAPAHPRGRLIDGPANRRHDPETRTACAKVLYHFNHGRMTDDVAKAAIVDLGLPEETAHEIVARHAAKVAS